MLAELIALLTSHNGRGTRPLNSETEFYADVMAIARARLLKGLTVREVLIIESAGQMPRNVPVKPDLAIGAGVGAAVAGGAEHRDRGQKVHGVSGGHAP